MFNEPVAFTLGAVDPATIGVDECSEGSPVIMADLARKSANSFRIFFSLIKYIIVLVLHEIKILRQRKGDPKVPFLFIYLYVYLAYRLAVEVDLHNTLHVADGK